MNINIQLHANNNLFCYKERRNKRTTAHFNNSVTLIFGNKTLSEYRVFDLAHILLDSLRPSTNFLKMFS